MVQTASAVGNHLGDLACRDYSIGIEASRARRSNCSVACAYSLLLLTDIHNRDLLVAAPWCRHR